MSKIVIYTKDPCPYCDRAKNLLNSKSLPFSEVDLTDSPTELEALKNKHGWRTVPMIFIDDVLIGGYTDLKALDEAGKLTSFTK